MYFEQAHHPPNHPPTHYILQPTISYNTLLPTHTTHPNIPHTLHPQHIQHFFLYNHYQSYIIYYQNLSTCTITVAIFKSTQSTNNLD